jgi:riboflavin kinase / FMN adenylyltransferase
MRHSAEMVAMEDVGCVSQPLIVRDGVDALPAGLHGSVLLLGNFDGLHLGHQSLIAEASQRARGSGRALAIVQFDPHPRHHFRGEQGFLISDPSVQWRLLAEAGIGLVYAPRFDAQFAAQTAQAFVLNHLVGRLGVSAVVAGADFRFGQYRAGDVPLLRAMGRSCGFTVHVVGECRDREGRGQDTGMRISSSHVRFLIRNGRLDEAQRLLGRPFETAIEAGPLGWQFDPMQILPPDGIFLVEARGIAGQQLSRGMLALKGRHPEARLPAGTSTLLWHATVSARTAETEIERISGGLLQS